MQCLTLNILIYVSFRKTQLLQTLKKKKECEKKALDIVIELIDGGLEEHTLLNKVIILKYYFIWLHILYFVVECAKIYKTCNS